MTIPDRDDPVAQHLARASSLFGTAFAHIDTNPERARLFIDAASVAIAIADHHQRGRIDLRDAIVRDLGALGVAQEAAVDAAPEPQGAEAGAGA